MPAVIYKELSEFPGYRVGSDGSFWSCWGTGRYAEMGSVWKEKKTHRAGKNYRAVTIHRNIQRYVHRLVLEAFVGKCPEGMECCHGDGDRTNNVLSNLRWDTPSANNLEKELHGTDKKGSERWNSKFTEDQILDLRTQFSLGKISISQLARDHSVNIVTMFNILRRKTWRHVS